MTQSRLFALAGRATSAVLWGPVVFGASFALSFLAMPRPADAQLFPGGPLQGLGGQFIEPPRALRQVLSDARTAANEKRFGDAVLLLGDLLARDEASAEDPLQGEDFFTPGSPGEELTAASLRRAAEEMLGNLPAEGRRLYELRYGADAAAGLRQAAERDDLRGLATVSRRYFHTEAGYQATLLLGYRLMQAGRPLSAALVWQRLHSAAAGRRQFDPQLSLALAGAWRAAGRDELARALIAELDAQEVRLAGEAKAVRVPSDAGDWLGQRFAGSVSPAREVGSETHLARGGANRIGAGGGEAPIRHPRWIVPTTSSSREERSLEAFQQAQASGGEVVLPSALPLVIGDTVVTRTTERVVAIDLVTGKRIWEYPWFSVDADFDDEGVPLQQLPEEEGQQLLYQRVWSDLPYGRISSDAARVYLLGDLNEVEPASMGGMGPFFGFRGTRTADAGTNTLVALELATEGKLVWTISGAETEDPRLRGAFFLGPPLPVDGRLYAIAEIGGDTYLVCLAPDSGQLLWRQHLLANDAGGVATDPIRRLSGAMPAYADGVLVCPTGQGAVVAVDLATRSLRWGWRYERTQMNPHQMNRRSAPDISDLMQRWYDGTPMIADGYVVLTPPESNLLFCLDLVTGKPRWQPRPRDRWHHVAGIREGRIVLASPTRLTAFELQTGGQAWPGVFELPEGEVVAGCGVFGEDSYYFATSKGRILEIDLETGQLQSSHAVDYPAGNLLAHDGQLISLGATGIAAAYGRETLDHLVTLRLEADPTDYWAIVRRGQLLLEEGRRSEALDYLQRARQRNPQDEEVRVLLVETLLAVLREDPSSADTVGPMLDELAEMPDRRGEMMRLLADAALANGQFEEAMRRLRELAELAADPRRWYAGSALDVLQLEQGHEVTVDAWIAARIGEIRDATTPETWDSLAGQFASWAEPMSAAPAPAQRQFLRQFGRLAASDPVRLDLARQSLRDGASLVAERLVLDGLARDGLAPQASRQWHLLLARIYADAGWVEDARAALEAGETGGAPATTDELAGLSRDELVAKISRGPEAPEWPAHVQLAGRSEDRRGHDSNARTLDVQGRAGHVWQGWQVLQSGEGTLQLRDPFGRIPGGPVRLEGMGPTGAGIYEAYFDSGLLLVVLPGELAAIDMFRALHSGGDAVLWRQPWRVGAGDKNGSHTTLLRSVRTKHLDRNNRPVMKVVEIAGSRILLLRGGELLCLDALTGQTVWRRDGVPNGSSGGGVAASTAVVGDADEVMAIASSGQTLRVSAWDGSLRESAPWPAQRRVWTTAGSKLLWEMQEGNEDEIRVGLTDALTGEELLERSLSRGAAGGLVENSLAMLLDQDGSGAIWDLVAGREITQYELELPSRLNALHGLRWGDSVIVLPECEWKSPEEGLEVVTSGSDAVLTVSGPIQAFDYGSGKAVWAEPVVVPSFGCVVDQPVGAPMLVLSRREQHRHESRGRTQNRLSLLGIDIRDGSILTRQDDLRLNFGPQRWWPEIEIEPDQRRSRVRLSTNLLVYQWSEASPDGESPEEETASQPRPPGIAEEPEPFDLFQPVEGP